MNEWMNEVCQQKHNPETLLDGSNCVQRGKTKKKMGYLQISIAAHPKNECNPAFKCQLFSPTEGIKKARGI